MVTLAMPLSCLLGRKCALECVLGAGLVLASCQNMDSGGQSGLTMSLEEATAVVDEAKFLDKDIPPRSASDVIALLGVEEWEHSRSGAPIRETVKKPEWRVFTNTAKIGGERVEFIDHSRVGEAEFSAYHHARAMNAFYSGKSETALLEFREALKWINRSLAVNRRTEGDLHREDLFDMSFAEFIVGRHWRAIEVLERARDIRSENDLLWNAAILGRLVHFYAFFGDVGKAERLFGDLEQAYYRARREFDPDGVLHTRAEQSLNLARGKLLEAQGRYAEAEPYLREALTLLQGHGYWAEQRSTEIFWHELWVAENKALQGRSLDAEIALRELVIASIGSRGKFSAESAWVAQAQTR